MNPQPPPPPPQHNPFGRPSAGPGPGQQPHTQQRYPQPGNTRHPGGPSVPGAHPGPFRPHPPVPHPSAQQSPVSQPPRHGTPTWVWIAVPLTLLALVVVTVAIVLGSAIREGKDELDSISAYPSPDSSQPGYGDPDYTDPDDSDPYDSQTPPTALPDRSGPESGGSGATPKGGPGGGPWSAGSPVAKAPDAPAAATADLGTKVAIRVSPLRYRSMNVFGDTTYNCLFSLDMFNLTGGTVEVGPEFRPAAGGPSWSSSPVELAAHSTTERVVGWESKSESALAVPKDRCVGEVVLTSLTVTG